MTHFFWTLLPIQAYFSLEYYNFLISSQEELEDHLASPHVVYKERQSPRGHCGHPCSAALCPPGARGAEQPPTPKGAPEWRLAVIL